MAGIGASILVVVIAFISLFKSGYDDEYIKNKYKLDDLAIYNIQILGIPCLSVVPDGKTEKISTIFDELSIETDHISGPLLKPSGNIVFVEWALSQSYILSIMMDRDEININSKATSDEILSKNGYGVRIYRLHK